MRLFKLILFAALLVMPVLTWAKGPAKVANGLHNLSSTGVDPWSPTVPGSSPYADKDEVQICVFCHTPHGGRLNAPLWNRSDANPAGGWNHYNSATMAIDPSLSVNRAPNDESMLCMSCHDGSVGVNHVVNLPNTRDGLPFQSWGGDTDMRIYADIIDSTPGKRIGAAIGNPTGTGDLSDDHPISFSYEQVVNSYAYTAGSKQNELKDAATATGLGVRFFGSASENFVECSSCHDPHVDYLSPGNEAYAPFLIMPNTNSDLCLACHTK